jgi:6-phosphogluconolactonase (cycloisomerase 2 family)
MVISPASAHSASESCSLAPRSLSCSHASHANGSDNAMVFKVDDKNGHLTPVGEPVPVVYPFCIRFLPVQ